jgi:hypothetical protein
MHRTKRDVRLLAVATGAAHLRQRLFLPLWLTIKHETTSSRFDYLYR